MAWLVDMCSSMPLTLLAGPTMWQVRNLYCSCEGLQDANVFLVCIS